MIRVSIKIPIVDVTTHPQAIRCNFDLGSRSEDRREAFMTGDRMLSWTHGLTDREIRMHVWMEGKKGQREWGRKEEERLSLLTVRREKGIWTWDAGRHEAANKTLTH